MQDSMHQLQVAKYANTKTKLLYNEQDSWTSIVNDC